MGKGQKCWEMWKLFRSPRELSVCSSRFSQSLPKAVIFSSPFPHIHLTVYSYDSLSPSFCLNSSWFNLKRRLSIPFLSQWHHFVLQWWDQLNTRTHARTHARAHTHRWLETWHKKIWRTAEMRTLALTLLGYFRELVRGWIRKSVCCQSWRGPLLGIFVFRANCETRSEKITMLVVGGLD